MKIVLDTNCLVVCLPATSPYYCLWKAFREMRIMLCYTSDIIKWNLITADPDDNKFVDCALNAGADYLVTNDHHFNILKSIDFPPIKVVDIETFKSILKV